MAENVEPTEERTEDVAEVEAHSSVLDAQGLSKDVDKSENSCVSLVSLVGAEY
ncbi:hypothetical protein AB0K51_14210 [Kitasatospora sp. NPDC049285]|uniref:hypothetical protein n=1 Tax=Kitasatospora sp. NPDC049285 TaxID=3157096 RepID=UPI0034187FA5